MAIISSQLKLQIHATYGKKHISFLTKVSLQTYFAAAEAASTTLIHSASSARAWGIN